VHPGRRRTTAGSNAPGAFLVFIIIIFYPAIRTGSSNTHFFPWLLFFSWSLIPDSRLLLGQTNTRHVFRCTGERHGSVFRPYEGRRCNQALKVTDSELSISALPNKQCFNIEYLKVFNSVFEAFFGSFALLRQNL